MKNAFITLVVLGAILTGSNALAGEPKILLSEKPSKFTLVTFENVSNGAVLYIKDTFGNNLYSEKIKTEGSLMKNFDLTQLPENKYFFEIDKKDLITQIPFYLEDGEAKILKDLKKNIFKPSVNLKGETVTVSREMNGIESYNIEIFYEGNELAYNEKIEQTGDLKRMYDFSGSISGLYLFSVRFNNRTYNEYVYINTMY